MPVAFLLGALSHLMPIAELDKQPSKLLDHTHDEVKAVLLAVAGEIEPSDPQSGLLLRTVSPHWLRHAYARTLVVDKRVPLPAAQALLGHASVQTTAAYAKTDLAQLREFVELGFSD